jgi:hypothetical protein
MRLKTIKAVFTVHLILSNKSHFCLMVKVGNVGGREFSESLAPDVQKLLVRV